MALRRSFTIINGNFPSGMWKELSGRNERRGILNSAEKIGQGLVIEAIAGITASPKAGNKYHHKVVGATRSSLAGTYPANQSGKLRNSVKYKVHGLSTFEFGAEADYAKYLQQSDTPNGTPRAGTGKIAERPLLTLAHNARKKTFIPTMRNEIMSEI